MTLARKLRVAAFTLIAIVGATTTLIFNIAFIRSGGFDKPLGFVESAMVNAASSSVFVDVAIAAGAGMLFMAIESRRLQIRGLWIYILLTVFVAFAFSFPAFLVARELRLAQRDG